MESKKDVFNAAREDFLRRLNTEKEQFTPRSTIVVDTPVSQSPDVNIQVVGFMSRGCAALVKLVDAIPRYENSSLVGDWLQASNKSLKSDQCPLNAHNIRTTLMIMKDPVHTMLGWFPDSLSDTLKEFLQSSITASELDDIYKKKLCKALVKLQNEASEPHVKRVIGEVNEAAHCWKQQRDKTKREATLIQLKFRLLRLVQFQGDVRRNKVLHDILYKKSTDLLAELAQAALTKEEEEDAGEQPPSDDKKKDIQWENSVMLPPFTFEEIATRPSLKNNLEEEEGRDDGFLLPPRHFVFTFDWENKGLKTVEVPPFPSTRKQVILCDQYTPYIYQYDGETLRILSVDHVSGDVSVHAVFLGVTPFVVPYNGMKEDKTPLNVNNYKDFQCCEDSRFSFVHKRSGDLLIFFLDVEKNVFQCKKLSANRKSVLAHPKLQTPFKLHRWSTPYCFSVVSAQNTIYKFTEYTKGDNSVFRLDGIFGMQDQADEIKYVQMDDCARRVCAMSALHILVNSKEGSIEKDGTPPLNHSRNIHFVSQMQLVGSYCATLCHNGMLVLWDSDGEEAATLSLPTGDKWFAGDVEGARNAFYFDESHRVISYSCDTKQFTSCCL